MHNAWYTVKVSSQLLLHKVINSFDRIVDDYWYYYYGRFLNGGM